eukprot:scaffold2.g6994.t1
MLRSALLLLTVAGLFARVAGLNATHSGYLPLGDDDDAAIFYVYFEAEELAADLPIIGGPGCSSLFGMVYEGIGPTVLDADLQLKPSPGSWGRRAGLLFLDQPVGVGYSRPGKRHPAPTEEMALAADLYAALQARAFFERFEALQTRPLIIAGESYAGKYVPSIGHYILQQASAPPLPGGGHAAGAGAARARLSNARGAAPARRRALPAAALPRRRLLGAPPLFDLRGLIIGSGLTDPGRQMMTLADTSYHLGLIDQGQRVEATMMQLETGHLIDAGLWALAHALRTDLLAFLARAGGVATMLDVRRLEEYDAGKTVDAYFNHPDVKARCVEELGVPPEIKYEACSGPVGEALGPDVMKSVAHLMPDLLAAYDILLFQGQFDGQDGPASNQAWIGDLDWPGRKAFAAAKRHIVRAWKTWDENPDSPSNNQAAASAAAVQHDGMQRKHMRRQGEEGEVCCEVGGEVQFSVQGQAGSAGNAGASSNSREALDQQLQWEEHGAAGPADGWLAAARRRDLRSTSAGAGGEPDGQRPQPQPPLQQPLGKGYEPWAHRVAAYWKAHGSLTHVVVRDAGHMVPADQPGVARWMVERWLGQVLKPTE